MSKKHVLIFSNPFGNGPAGKAISIGEYILAHTNQDIVTVTLCGGNQLQSLAGDKFLFIKLNERDETEIRAVLQSMKDPTYVISSQNRFAIRVAHSLGIPSAFLDGLAWFWNTIPEEHFLADIIFWLNYKNITGKIPPPHKDKINIIHGISDEFSSREDTPRDDSILLYLGGCKNPLTPIPTHYLDLFASIIERASPKSTKLKIATDPASFEYLKQYPSLANLLVQYNHHDFMCELSHSKKFITNGGQTATLEASHVDTPISFFLPINLSQLALITTLHTYSSIDWHNYIDVPKDISDYSEKDAIDMFNKLSLQLLKDPHQHGQLCKDFLIMLEEKNEPIPETNTLSAIGYTGAQDIYAILQKAWGI